MKIRVVFVVLMIFYLMLSTLSSAIAESHIKAIEGNLFNYLIDDYIQKCQSKSNLRDSRSKNIRNEASLAALKVQYLTANKDKLIDKMLKTELSMKKYKVHYFLNTRFFNYFSSKSNLQRKVIEANLSKSKYR